MITIFPVGTTTPKSQFRFVWCGSSFTAGNYYRPLVNSYIQSNYLGEYAVTIHNAALSGHGSFSNLVRLSRDVLANNPTTIFYDHANVFDEDMFEAFIRLTLTSNADIKIILMESSTWFGQDCSDNGIVTTPTNEADIDSVNALATHYSLPIMGYWTWVQSVVPGTYNLNQLTGDCAHPTETPAEEWIAGAIEGELNTGVDGAGGALPAALYSPSDWENDPVITNGTGYDSKTGTWVEDGGRASSTEAGATITFSATCQRFGCYRSDGVGTGIKNDVEVSIDGGAFSDENFNQYGTAIAAGRGAHTIAIKVKTTEVVIDEFWAI